MSDDTGVPQETSSQAVAGAVDPREILAVIDAKAEEMVEFAAELVRIPTINPPGRSYRRCARLIADRMRALGFDVETSEPAERPEHTAEHPRVNVVGTVAQGSPRPCIHFNGHIDVVPPGSGWTVDPFGGVIKDGRLYGRGSADMKAGLAAALYAAHAVHEAGAIRSGKVEVSATVDEESGGFAGVAHLAEVGRISADRTDHVIIPEPFGPRGISLGHRGVYWFKVTAHGRTAHGSMPHLGQSAIDDLAALVELIRNELGPKIAQRTTKMPVVPHAARSGSINVNSIVGGQAGNEATPAPEGSARAEGTVETDVVPTQTPCVADHAEAVFDRRFLAEETFEEVRAEIEGIIAQAVREKSGRRYELTDLMVVHPTLTAESSPLVGALKRSIEQVVQRPAKLVASPGTYDQKHVVGIAGVTNCVAYGPGELEQAHQPDESCAVADIVNSAKVMALTAVDLLG